VNLYEMQTYQAWLRREQGASGQVLSLESA
jgi:hypothetical protein